MKRSSFDELTVRPIEDLGRRISFTVDRNECLREVFDPKKVMALCEEKKENIIVEFSSPNIAKPFHMGHLRSTIIGNALANLLALFGHNVTRINYLGDWGTQFGFLKLGMEMANYPDEQVKKDPIKHLFEAYVSANRAAEKDETFADRARNVFTQMENGAAPDLEAWDQYKEYTVAELTRVYRRLGVHFDAYEWESQYCKSNIKHILERMQADNLLITDSDGRQCVEMHDDRVVPLVKSDGTTLYLTRDVAAVVERQKKYNFDRMLYVVGNDQHLHFQSLFEIATRMGVPNADKLRHIKFGRVEKMSTRKGNVVFLADVLDEVKSTMYEKQLADSSEYDPTAEIADFCLRIPLSFLDTRVDVTVDQDTADVLGVSAIIQYELSRSRTSSYAFDVDQLQHATSGGKNLHYTHCRLLRLDERNPVEGPIEFKPEYLDEREAISLAFEIAKFPEVLLRARNELGPQVILTYLYSLNSITSKTLSKLNVLHETSAERKAQRILLFRTARATLAFGMKLIGITPLEKM